MNDRHNQIVLVLGRPDVGGRSVTRIVRDVRQWDGRTVGWIRHDRGDWVVQLEPVGHWIVLSGVSVADIRTPVEPYDAEAELARLDTDGRRGLTRRAGHYGRNR